ncbi:MAG: DUF1559 domain-containing protein [Planctomycetaceae bacterium]
MKLTRKFVRSQRRSGFTLIELLVVISIIATLIALVAPAVQSARATARKLECQSNLRQVCLAVNAFASQNRGQVPPLVNWHGTNATPPVYSWVVSLFPHLDSAPIHRAITEYAGAAPATPFSAAAPPPVIRVLTCPVDLTNNGVPGGISYVANVGYMNSAVAPNTQTHNGLGIDGNGSGGAIDSADLLIARSTGVFWRCAPLTTAGVNNTTSDLGTSMSLDYIADADGQTNTYLIAENLQSNLWCSNTTYQTSVNTGDLGFGIFTYSNATTKIGTIMNTGAPATTPLVLVTAPALTSSAINFNYAGAAIGMAPRPSSNHSGIANIGFCDGRVEAVSANINSRIYASQLTPNGQRQGQPASDNYQ